MDIENIKLLLKDYKELKPKADKYDKVKEKLQKKIKECETKINLLNEDLEYHYHIDCVLEFTQECLKEME